MADNRYCIEYAKTGRSSCKKCKSQIEKGVPRVGKITPNPFSDDEGDMKVWYHMRCMFETLKRARTAKKIETPADIEGFPDMKDEEKEEIRKLIAEFDVPKPAAKAGKTGTKTGKAAASKASGGASMQALLTSSSKLSTSEGYTGDVYVLVKLLLPTAGKKRVYNLQSKQIVKLLSQVHVFPVSPLQLSTSTSTCQFKC
jgi:DNA ligase-3